MVRTGHFLFLAGQIPIDTSKPGSPLIRGYDDIPEEGRFLRVGRSHEDTRNGPIASQTWFTYDVIRRHLEAVGSSLDHVLNLIVYLQDIRDFPTFHRVHERFFGSKPPALDGDRSGRSGTQGTLIEIEPTASHAGAARSTRVFSTGWLESACTHERLRECGRPRLLFRYRRRRRRFASHALHTYRRESLSAEETRDLYATQTRTAIGELVRRFEAAGQSTANIVHLTVYLNDIHAVPPSSACSATSWGPGGRG